MVDNRDGKRQTQPSARPDSDDFLQLFLSDTPMLDTRAPVEYAKGSFPHTMNLPLMTDAEREKVGTCYKQQGQEAAIELGHRLVAGDVKQQRIADWLAFAKAHPDGYLFCFRGGLRSKICQQWLAEAGCDYPRITGGYKAMRRFLIDTIDDIAGHHPLQILAGQTGAAKTELLLRLDNQVDLEGLAHHRGSAFGKRVGGQPSQIDFENKLAIALLRQHHRMPDRSIVLEDESFLIGRCAIPDALRHAMAAAPVVLLEADLEQRVEHSFQNYILNKLDEWQQVEGEQQGFTRFANDLLNSLKNISRRLGGERYQHLQSVMQQALDEQQRGDNSLHREWIRILLRDYYDPLYNFQLEGKQGRIVFRGKAAEVIDYLSC